MAPGAPRQCWPGEKDNGDSLVMIEDQAIANMYAIEAVALFDHYHFRKKMRETPNAKALTLWYPNKLGMPHPWWKQYYDPSQIQMRDRYLFAGLELPARAIRDKVCGLGSYRQGRSCAQDKEGANAAQGRSCT
jgi:hypothetical protein